MTTSSAPQAVSSATPSSHGHAPTGVWKLALPALGVVYGDIGTSPLYALKECFHGEHAVATNPENVYGVLSLVFYTLTFVVTIKYLTFILRADNHGEGGILALLALVPSDRKRGLVKGPGVLVLLVIFGAALLYGDGMITPAISVISAVEGLEVATSAFKPAVVPLTAVILIVLFFAQKRGTARVGMIFGPAMLIWFSLIGGLGIREIIANPAVLAALDPRHAVTFFIHNRTQGFLALGGVVLAITGAEALYADMGHFGAKPIRMSWYSMVFPALLLNYFGQGAAILSHPKYAENPFYSIVPTWALYPTVIIATVATVVASQALISGAFSLTQQAVQLGFFPRVTIVHTSKDTEGQIYIPEINWMLLVACIGLVVGFKTSDALAGAYGIAVTGTMAITSVTYYVVMTRTWHWPVWRAAPLAGAFLIVDITYFASTSVKFFEGGWFPILMGLGVYTMMTTWSAGRRHLAVQMAKAMFPLDLFLRDIAQSPPHRVKGTAVFMASNANGVPPVMLHHFKHNQSLHEQVVLLTVVSQHVPEVPAADSLSLESLGHGFFRVTVRYGFIQAPDIPAALADCARLGLVTKPMQTSYYLGRETLLPTGAAKMMRWRKGLFAFISRNAVSATAYFGLPPGRVVELGMQINI